MNRSLSVSLSSVSLSSVCLSLYLVSMVGYFVNLLSLETAREDVSVLGLLVAGRFCGCLEVISINWEATFW